MKPTPGQALLAETKKRGISLTDFAKKKEVNKSFQTVWNWTRDRGFGAEQRRLAALGLGEDENFFDQPTLVEQREVFRLAVLHELRESAFGKSMTKDEWRMAESLRWPQGREPTVVAYKGIVRIIRGHLTEEEFADSIDDMERAEADNRATQSRDAEPLKPGGGARKKSLRRAAPTKKRTLSRK